MPTAVVQELGSTIAGSAWYIDRLQDQIGTLKGNQIVLETKIKEQNEAIETALNNQKKAQTLMASLEKEKHNAVYIPNGVAHGFAVKSKMAVLVYLTTTVYNQKMRV